MLTLVLNPISVLSLVAAGQSLFFDYFPKVATWFEKLEAYQKKQLTAGLGVFFAVALFTLSCQGYLVTDLTCEPVSLVNLAGNIVLSVGVGYAFHNQTKPSYETKEKLDIV